MVYYNHHVTEYYNPWKNTKQPGFFPLLQKWGFNTMATNG